MDSAPPCKIGDKSTSDIVVRLRTQEGRDDRFYCHSHILVEKSKYFAERLSENWPTCQILDSRNCVEVHCQESDFNHHVNFIRLLYDFKDCSSDDIGYGVKNTLGILQVAVDLGSPKIATACVNYLEAVPWEEADEEEILRIIPAMGPLGEPILARLQPVDPSSVRRIFLATVCFVTSSPPLPLNDLKTSAQEQLEYMLTEDDDAPLLTADDELKFDVKECVKGLFTRFNSLLEDLLRDAEEPVLDKPPNMQAFLSFLSDLLWASQILNKLEIMREFVNSWVDVSYKVIQVSGKANLSSEIIKLKLKIIEVAVKVLEAIGYGTVILPTAKRLQAVKAWLPFVQVTKPLIDTGISDTEDSQELKVDGEMWQTLESSFISTLLALPSEDQAEILTDWLGSEHIRYPDFSEAFELWCYRSKVAKRRLQDIGQNHRCGN